jgi:4-hydroxy-tetrahydrodipicolinate synthase
MFAGVWTAIATPMREGSIDWDALDRLIDLQAMGGVTGIVPCGTTGESPTISRDEKARLFSRCVQKSLGRLKVCAGVGSNNTEEAVEFTREAVAHGVDAVMSVVPSYNKPPQRGLVAHFTEVAKAAGSTPVMLYNVPGRTSCNMLPATAGEIAWTCPNVGAIKEASGDLGQLSRCVEIAEGFGDSRPPFEVLCGDDGFLLASLPLGAVGLVSVASNVEPELVVSVIKHFQAGEIVKARMAQQKLNAMVAALFCDTSPIPVKHWLAVAHGIGDGSVRLPLAVADQKVKDAVVLARKAIA